MTETKLPLSSIFRQMLEMEYDNLEKNIRSALDTSPLDIVESDGNYQDLKKQFHSYCNEPETTAGSFSNSLLKHALFISAYSFMEYSLRKFCEITTLKHPQYKRRVSDFEKVYQFYFYLINDLHLDKSKVEEDWEKLSIFRDIRNSIVHYNSTIGKNISSKAYGFIKEDPRIQFIEPRSFFIEEVDLIMDLTNVSKRFLFSLIREYEAV